MPLPLLLTIFLVLICTVAPPLILVFISVFNLILILVFVLFSLAVLLFVLVLLLFLLLALILILVFVFFLVFIFFLVLILTPPCFIIFPFWRISLGTTVMTVICLGFVLFLGLLRTLPPAPVVGAHKVLLCELCCTLCVWEVWGCVRTFLFLLMLIPM